VRKQAHSIPPALRLSAILTAGRVLNVRAKVLGGSNIEEKERKRNFSMDDHVSCSVVPPKTSNKNKTSVKRHALVLLYPYV
jgi:hypothetical protein